MTLIEKESDLYGMELLLRMSARYGSKQILPRMKAFAERPNTIMVSEELAYFLRVDEAYGVAHFKQELARRNGYARFWSSLYSRVAADYWSPALEPLAIESLMDGEPEVAVDAAAMLARHGSPEAMKKIVAALKAKWTLANPHDKHTPENPAALRESQLTYYLLHSNKWRLPDEELRPLRDAVQSPEVKTMIDDEIKRRNEPGPA
jgi:hypothetical protein